jgi:hypothetical protein
VAAADFSIEATATSPRGLGSARRSVTVLTPATALLQVRDDLGHLSSTVPGVNANLDRVKTHLLDSPGSQGAGFWLATGSPPNAINELREAVAGLDDAALHDPTLDVRPPEHQLALIGHAIASDTVNQAKALQPTSPGIAKANDELARGMGYLKSGDLRRALEWFGNASVTARGLLPRT